MSTPEDIQPTPAPEPTAPTPSTTPPPHAAAPHATDTLAEQFARAYLMDRRSERRWRIFFRLSWLLLVIAIVYGVAVTRNKINAPTGPHTALIEVRGEIAVDTEASAENLVAGLKGAFEDAESQAVVLRINSPGGSPVQAGIVNDEIRRLKAKHKKPVYAVVERTFDGARQRLTLKP